MDLHILGAEPSDDERAAIDGLLGPTTSAWEGGPRDSGAASRTSRAGLRDVRNRRDQLLPALHAVQDRVGWISRGALNHICRRLMVPPAEAWGVVTFYHLFRTEPTPGRVLHVCDDIACRLHPSAAANQSSRGADTLIRPSPCLGLCDTAPAALLMHAGTEPSVEVIGSGEPAVGGTRKLLRRVGVTDPSSLASYRAHGGYEALARAFDIGAAAVVAEVTAANLLGRGGAAFPTGRKWAAVAAQPLRPHYLVCNADESEPGTFKDRILLERDPFALIEAMTIAAFATGCERGFIYIRGEYASARQRLQHAIAAAYGDGLLGAGILGGNVAFDLEIRRGAGAYICGEETALFNSLEGKRGEPRSKPPFPVQSGLFGYPTLVNNVETLVNVIDIVREGGARWASTGTAASTGTRLFCLSGHVTRPGLYEAPLGTALGDLLAMAGGIAAGRALQAILLGGAAGTFVGPDQLSLPLTFEDARAAGATLGSGVVMVFDERVDLRDTLLRIAQFMRDESCGQCVPCRIGTVRQVELLQRLHAQPTPAAVALLAELGQAMRDASICGLGQTASSAVESALSRLAMYRQ